MKETIIHLSREIKNRLFTLAKTLWQHWDMVVTSVLAAALMAGIFWYQNRYTPAQEQSVRNHVVRVAQSYLGCNEADGSHRQIIDIYNAHEPHPRDYAVTYEDSWCAVFTGAVTLQANMLGWIPLECSCEQQILLFDTQGEWVENDCYLPKSGDLIYYDWNSKGSGDCTGWSDHVGIVVSTFGPVIKVIEGNKDDDVSHRYIFVNDPFIRGYGTPNYSAIQ